MDALSNGLNAVAARVRILEKQANQSSIALDPFASRVFSSAKTLHDILDLALAQPHQSLAKAVHTAVDRGVIGKKLANRVRRVARAANLVKHTSAFALSSVEEDLLAHLRAHPAAPEPDLAAGQALLAEASSSGLDPSSSDHELAEHPDDLEHPVLPQPQVAAQQPLVFDIFDQDDADQDAFEAILKVHHCVLQRRRLDLQPELDRLKALTDEITISDFVAGVDSRCDGPLATDDFDYIDFACNADEQLLLPPARVVRKLDELHTAAMIFHDSVQSDSPDDILRSYEGFPIDIHGEESREIASVVADELNIGDILTGFPEEVLEFACELDST